MSEETYEDLEQRVKVLEQEKAALQEMVRKFTDEKPTGKSTQEADERYRDFFDNALVGLFRSRLSDGFIIEANSKAAELIDLSVEEVVGKVSLSDYYRFPEQRIELVKRLQKEGEVHDFEIDLILINGRNVVLSVSVKIYPEEGYMEGAVVDITDRKKAEEDLEFERKQLFSVFDSLDEHIYISDPNTYEVLYVNKALEASSGKDVVGGICYEKFQGLDAPCEFCTNQIILERKPEPYRWEIFKPKSGRTLALVDRIIKWPDGRDVRLEFSSDVTDRKRLEERTQQTQKMEAIGTLASGIAHDFNNILSGIFGYTQLLQMKMEEGSKTSKYVDAIYQAGIRAKDLVQQILAFSRQKTQESMPMKIQDVVNEALQLIQSTLPSTISISSDVQADCGLVRGDQTQIHQIVMNLCTNAYHAMEENGGQLTVVLAELEMAAEDLNDPSMEPGLYACLSVIDTGMGIEPQIMDRIFEPYFTTKRKGKGTGMGLAVAHGIIKGHGGQINVYTKPDKGSEFRVLLPVIAENMNASPKADSNSLLKGNEHVLLVDDQKEVLEIEKQMIQELGYRVTTRTSSLEALERFRAGPDQFDIMITDMTMPNMTGDQLAKEVNQIRADIPILLCTGFSEQMSEAKAESIGFKGFLMKPIAMKDLSEMIRKALDGKRV